MNSRDTSRFKIRFDEDTSLTGGQLGINNEVEDLRINKLRRKTNVLTFLIPLLLGSVIAFGYLDLRNRYDKNVSAGTSEMQSLSKALESKFSSLSIRQAKLESMLPEKLAEIEKATVSLKIKLQQAETILTDNMKASKSGNQALQSRIEAVAKTITPVHAEIKKIDDQLKSLESKFAKELSSLSTAVDKTTSDLLKKTSTALENKLDERLDSKLDKKMFELALKHEEKMMQQKMAALNSRLTEQLRTIQQKLTQLEKTQLKPSAQKPAQRTESSSPGQTAPSPSVPQPAEKNAGGIVEKDLR